MNKTKGMCYNYHVVSGVYYSTYPFEAPAGVAASAGLFCSALIVTQFRLDKKNKCSYVISGYKIADEREARMWTTEN